MPGGDGDLGLLQLDYGQERCIRVQAQSLGIALVGLLQLLGLLIADGLVVRQRCIFEALLFSCQVSLQRFRVALEHFQRHAAVELRRAQRLLQGHGLFKVLQRLLVAHVVQQIGAAVDKRPPASKCIEGRLGIDLLHGIRPSRIRIFETEIALYRQHREHQAQYASNGQHRLARKKQQPQGQQSRQEHRPDIAAVQHKGVLQPGRHKLGTEEDGRAQQRQADQAPGIALAQQEIETAQHQSDVAQCAQPMRPARESQRESRPQIDGHPLHIRHQPQESIVEEQGCLVHQAQGEDRFRDTGVQGFQLVHIGPGVIVRRHGAHKCTHVLPQRRREYAHQHGNAHNDGQHRLPVRALDEDIQRQSQRWQNHCVLFAHQRQHHAQHG